MKRITLILGSMIIIITAAVLACNSNKNEEKNREGISEIPKPVSQDSLISRGQYLVTIMGCNDCHSPKIMGPRGPEIDTTRILSGHPSSMPVAAYDAATTKNWVLFNMTGTAMVGPWGTSFSANITSDETGIGNWSEAQFFKAIREGKYKGMDNTRPLLPPMPWPVYAQASDDDLRSIFAYLKSTKPVDNVVPAPIVPNNQLSKMN